MSAIKFEIRDYKKLHKDIIEWIRNWFEVNGKGCNAVIGISGGKDSTICCALLCEAIGKDRVIGLMLPNGTQHDLNVAQEICEYYGYITENKFKAVVFPVVLPPKRCNIILLNDIFHFIFA